MGQWSAYISSKLARGTKHLGLGYQCNQGDTIEHYFRTGANTITNRLIISNFIDPKLPLGTFNVACLDGHSTGGMRSGHALSKDQVSEIIDRFLALGPQDVIDPAAIVGACAVEKVSKSLGVHVEVKEAATSVAVSSELVTTG